MLEDTAESSARERAITARVYPTRRISEAMKPVRMVRASAVLMVRSIISSSRRR
jgi:hypothetical protein